MLAAWPMQMVFTGEKQHLRHNQVGHLVVDGRAQKDDVVAQQT
jgi:hypothetical protein